MRQPYGYSLIELVIIIAVLGIMSIAVSMCQPSGVQQAFQAEGFARVFLQDLQLTKVLAMSQNQRYRLVVGTNSYQIQNQNGTPVTHPGTGGSSVPYPAGVSIAPLTTVMFDSLGQPYNNAGVPLGSTLSFTITSGSEASSVSVVPQTGLIQ
ncbi:pilus assembly FimT family protein [Legionella oakridgensis]|uniref:Prokaryotic N-terminal methylation motif protein n=2 Tax=Legionella oakridgensis TaxID=29423 RepID=W0BJ03_9GAMM|nr:prepilin-type N-terminal cleavage/methylation domain-containing protein [Legionella oakridgensis]AHE68389.1 prokaryotic N-terminal methylation motif protein [Legionella oakridgensis ATCC 33761 = DSM 21215]ETO92161.1 hypothetical protein LOR_70c19770 [Legionella oakridgensis RV-2-2007]KTD38944.1 hypothetical protein Loak_1065 [Legionella oakridgensis]STY21328.1 Tfp pilus assembly protein FimT [Legionella longbeachae]